MGQYILEYTFPPSVLQVLQMVAVNLSPTTSDFYIHVTAHRDKFPHNKTN
jgi:hypothetical protein